MINQTGRPRTPKQYARLFLTGIAMGAADVVPGVSGGTMAFIMGIYEELLNAIKSFNVTLAKLIMRFQIKAALDHVPWKFMLALGSGILVAIFTLAGVLSWLLEHQPVYIFSFFFGLILASIVAIGTQMKWTSLTLVMLLVGTVAAYLIVGLVPVNMPNDPLTLFLSGAVAIMAMILPGISGSFILLILGQYTFILNAVKTFDLVSVLSVALGCAVGIIGFARVLSWLLKHYQQATIAVLVGFMVGSLRKIWPWKVTLETMVDRHGELVPIREANVLPTFGSAEFLIAVALCLLGFVVISFIDHQQTKTNPLFRGRKRGNVDIAAAKH